MDMKLLSGLFLVAFLSACGGGGSSSSSGSNDVSSGSDNGSGGQGAGSDVSVEDENLTYAATEITKQAIALESAPSLGEALSGGATGGQKTQQPLSATEMFDSTELGPCGGSISTSGVITTPDEPNQIFPFTLDGDVVFNDYCVSEDGFESVINGDAEFLFDVSESSSLFSFVYDFSFTSDNPLIPSGSFMAAETCTVEGDGPVVCESSTSYQTLDGETFSLSEIELTGSPETGLNLNGEFDAEDGESYTIMASNLTLCDNGNFQSGTIIISNGSGEQISVSFPNCNELTVTIDGVATTLPQTQS